MQSLLLPAPWFSKTHFGPLRFDIDPGRVSVHLRPPSSAGPKASLRSSYSALPMSGIVPTGTQAPQSADTNTAPTPRGQQGGERANISTPADQNRSDLPPRLPTLIPIEGPGVVSTQPPRFLSTEELLVNPTTQVPSIGSTVSLSQVISGSPQLGLHGVPPSGAIRALPPRSTRRAKAHVASACVNCKRKHLGCDSARPCRRCVLSGKAVCLCRKRDWDYTNSFLVDMCRRHTQEKGTPASQSRRDTLESRTFSRQLGDSARTIPNSTDCAWAKSPQDIFTRNSTSDRSTILPTRTRPSSIRWRYQPASCIFRKMAALHIASNASFRAQSTTCIIRGTFTHICYQLCTY